MNSATVGLRERKTAFIEIFRTTPARTVCPNFYVLAHANGCSFTPQCSYCYLKSSFWFLDRCEAFTNGVKLIEEVRHWIARDRLESYVLNAGNLSDSLAFEEIRPLMVHLIETFRTEAGGRPHTLLLVTKGGKRECKSLFSVEPCENVIVSFSVNNSEAAYRHENGAAPVDERLHAAAGLKKLGWRIRIRLDPMLLGYDYSRVLEDIRGLAPERVTLGTLRAERSLSRFTGNELFSELEPSQEKNSLARYPLAQRLRLYRQAVGMLRDLCPIALCEEEEAVWDNLGLDKVGKQCNCCL